MTRKQIAELLEQANVFVADDNTAADYRTAEHGLHDPLTCGENDIVLELCMESLFDDTTEADHQFTLGALLRAKPNVRRTWAHVRDYAGDMVALAFKAEVVTELRIP